MNNRQKENLIFILGSQNEQTNFYLAKEIQILFSFFSFLAFQKIKEYIPLLAQAPKTFFYIFSPF